MGLLRGVGWCPQCMDLNIDASDDMANTQKKIINCTQKTRSPRLSPSNDDDSFGDGDDGDGDNDRINCPVLRPASDRKPNAYLIWRTMIGHTHPVAAGAGRRRRPPRCSRAVAAANRVDRRMSMLLCRRSVAVNGASRLASRLAQWVMLCVHSAQVCACVPSSKRAR